METILSGIQEGELQTFYEWIDIYDCYRDIPSEYHAYINWEKLFTDNIQHGTLNIHQLNPGKYFMIDIKEF